MRFNSGDKQFSCDTCEKSFSKASNLTRHKIIHTREKPYSCDLCKKSFSLKSHLTSHKKIIHEETGIKPYPCNTCGKAFRTSSKLTVHKRIHTGEKPYPCEICQKSFCTNSELSKHNKSAGHLKMSESSQNTVIPPATSSFVGVCNIKLFSCIVCGKRFESEDVLTNHKYLHPEYKSNKDIKLEIKEEDTFDDDPLSIKLEAENVEETIKQEKEEEIHSEDPLSC